MSEAAKRPSRMEVAGIEPASLKNLTLAYYKLIRIFGFLLSALTGEITQKASFSIFTLKLKEKSFKASPLECQFRP